jgi:hypothetical protein
VEFTITPSPSLIAAFLASFAGIVFVLLSRNVHAKRIALPITLVVFSGVWFEIFRRATDSSGVILGLVAAGLLANALWVTRRIAYCKTCGRTVQDLSRANPTQCSECSAAV